MYILEYTVDGKISSRPSNNKQITRLYVEGV